MRLCQTLEAEIGRAVVCLYWSPSVSVSLCHSSNLCLPSFLSKPQALLISLLPSLRSFSLPSWCLLLLLPPLPLLIPFSHPLFFLPPTFISLSILLYYFHSLSSSHLPSFLSSLHTHLFLLVFPLRFLHSLPSLCLFLFPISPSSSYSVSLGTFFPN